MVIYGTSKSCLSSSANKFIFRRECLDSLSKKAPKPFISMCLVHGYRYFIPFDSPIVKAGLDGKVQTHLSPDCLRYRRIVCSSVALGHSPAHESKILSSLYCSHMIPSGICTNHDLHVDSIFRSVCPDDLHSTSLIHARKRTTGSMD